MQPHKRHLGWSPAHTLVLYCIPRTGIHLREIAPRAHTAHHCRGAHRPRHLLPQHSESPRGVYREVGKTQRYRIRHAGWYTKAETHRKRTKGSDSLVRQIYRRHQVDIQSYTRQNTDAGTATAVQCGRLGSHLLLHHGKRSDHQRLYRILFCLRHDISSHHHTHIHHTRNSTAETTDKQSETNSRGKTGDGTERATGGRAVRQHRDDRRLVPLCQRRTNGAGRHQPLHSSRRICGNSGKVGMRQVYTHETAFRIRKAHKGKHLLRQPRPLEGGQDKPQTKNRMLPTERKPLHRRPLPQHHHHSPMGYTRRRLGGAENG